MFPIPNLQFRNEKLPISIHQSSIHESYVVEKQCAPTMACSSSQSKRRGRGAGAPEFISLDGLRLDGRRPHEVRKIRAALGALARADGSAYFEMGNTCVLAAVYGPRDARADGGGGGGGGSAMAAMTSDGNTELRCEYSTALFATPHRTRGWKGDRRSQALARVVARVCAGVVLSRHRGARIDVYVQVLQDDGAALAAAINASTLALVNAGVPMHDLVVACGVGYVDKTFVVDVAAAESAADRPELVVAMAANAGSVVAVELDSKLPDVDVLKEAMVHAAKGVRQIFKVLEHHVTEYSQHLLSTRGLVAF